MDSFQDLTTQRLHEFRSLILEYASNYSQADGNFVFIITTPNFAFNLIARGLISLQVSTAPTYPAYPAKVDVEFILKGISHVKVSELNSAVRELAHERRGETWLRDLIELVRSFAESVSQEETSEEDEEPVEEELVEGVPQQYWVDKQLIGRVERLDATAAQAFMGKTTIQSIEASLPSYLKLLHAEVVLRSNLLSRFVRAREILTETYIDRVRRKGGSRRHQDEMVDKLTQTKVVFHGTLRRHVGSIVQSGFVIPGRKTVAGQEVEVRCGATFGVGTYTSPELTYSLSYSDLTLKEPKLLPGQKIIVCAALMGQAYEIPAGEHLRWNTAVERGYDSHISPGKMEYVIFNPAHLLPLYVLHLDNSYASSKYAWNSKPADTSPAVARADLASNLNGARADLTLTMRRKLLTEQARKHFPIGYGAASGTKFVVEEIAPIDDDEEVWGEYQEQADGDDRFSSLLDELDAVGEFQKMRIK